MRVLRRIWCVLGATLGVVVLAACGDVYADPDPAAVSVDAGVVIDAAISPVIPEDTVPQCPTSRPRENTSCSQVGSACEYGQSADRECNTVLACDGASFDGAWSPRLTDTCFDSVCPELASVAELDGTPCALETDGGAITDADEAVCNMTDGVCACTTGRDGTTKHERRWVCVRPLSVCPPSRPLLGAPCSGSKWCDYGSCSFKRGVAMECKDGSWLTGGATCE